MVALKATAQKKSENSTGVRYLDVNRDVGQVVSLLELVFRQNLKASGRRAIAPASYPLQGLLTRNKPVYGFVYEDNGRIVGNVSLITSHTKGRFLIANVAVHPDFRRRGIARRMMQSVMQYTHSKTATKLILQVEEDNAKAIELYRSLGFRAVGTAKLWHMSYYNLHPLPMPDPLNFRRPDQYSGFELRTLRAAEWRSAYNLDREAFPADMNWPEPISLNNYKQNLAQWWHNFYIGRQIECWTAVTPRNEIIGLGVIQSEWARPHMLKLRVKPEWSDHVYRPLVAKMLRRIRYLRRRPLHIEHPKPDPTATELFKEAGFQHRRTLTTMVLTPDR